MAGSCWPIDLLPVDETMLACCTPWLAWCRRGERSGGGCGQRRHESERTCESSSPFWIDAQCGGRSKFEEDRLRHPWRPTAATSACVMRSINREMGSRSALVIRRDRGRCGRASRRATERLNGHAHLRKRSASSVWAPRATHWRRHGIAPLCPAPGVVAASASPRVTRKQLWPALWRRRQSAGSRVTRLTNRNHGMISLNVLVQPRP